MYQRLSDLGFRLGRFGDRLALLPCVSWTRCVCLTREDHRVGLEGRFYRSIVPRAIRHADDVVTISQFSRDEIRRLFGTELRIADPG